MVEEKQAPSPKNSRLKGGGDAAPDPSHDLELSHQHLCHCCRASPWVLRAHGTCQTSLSACQLCAEQGPRQWPPGCQWLCPTPVTQWEATDESVLVSGSEVWPGVTLPSLGFRTTPDSVFRAPLEGIRSY